MIALMPAPEAEVTNFEHAIYVVEKTNGREEIACDEVDLREGWFLFNRLKGYEDKKYPRYFLVAMLQELHVVSIKRVDALLTLQQIKFAAQANISLADYANNLLDAEKNGIPTSTSRPVDHTDTPRLETVPDLYQEVLGGSPDEGGGSE